jgi:hypothetical protein
LGNEFGLATVRKFSFSMVYHYFLFTSAITFPFEIRDLGRDPFPTLPKAIGIKTLKS